MLNLKTFKPFFVGFLLGVLVLGSGAGLFAKSYVDGAKTDYSDEADKLSTLVDEAKDPLLQKDYVITGLILSDKFNEFLEEGVQEGLWTEEFLIQFGGDYSIPILLKNYADVIFAVASTDKAKAAAKTISKVADALTKVKLQLQLVGPKLVDLIEKLKDPDLKADALAQIKETVFTILQNAGITAAIANILNKLGVFKFKVQDTLGSFKRVIAKVKDSLAEFKELFAQLKDPALKEKALAQIKEKVFTILQNMGITAAVANILNKLEIFKFKINDTLASFKRAAATVQDTLSELKGLVAQLKDPALKEKALAQIKSIVFNTLHNMGITAAIANLLNNLEVFKFKVRDTLHSFNRVIENIKELVTKLKDPALKDEVLAQIKDKAFTILQNAGITAAIANLLNKLDVFKFKVQDTLESFKNVISALKDPALKAELVSKLKSLINSKLASLGIQAKIDEVMNQIKELIAKVKNFDIEGIKTQITAIVKDLINNKLASLGIQAKIDEIMNQLDELVAKIKNFDLGALKANIIASVEAILGGKLSEVQAAIQAKIDEIISTIKDKLNPSAIEAMIMAFVASHSDELAAKISQFITANQDQIKDAIINSIASHIDLSAIQVAIENINNIIERLQHLEEQMPEIKDQIEAIIDSFNNLIDILNSIDVNGIEESINAIVDQLDMIFDQIDQIAAVVGNASAVIGAIMSQEDVEKDDWDFIPALKAYDDSLKAINLPKDLYTKLNVMEPVLNVLTLDIDYTYTEDDGNMMNGNSAELVIKHVNVGKESSTNSRDVIDGSITFGGVLAGTINGFLPVLNDNI